jgi:alkylation response protein AidB-like acyl-CoA dehydrogenase
VQWELSAEQDAYQEAFRGWLSAEAPPAQVRQWLDAGDAGVFEAKFAAAGWAGVGLPEELGGQGGGLVELALTAEELARAAAPSAAWLATVLAAPALAGQPSLVTSALAGQTAALLLPAETPPDQPPPVSLATDSATSATSGADSTPSGAGGAASGAGGAASGAGGAASGASGALSGAGGAPRGAGRTPSGAGGTISGAVARVLAGDSAARFVVPAGDGLWLVEAADSGVQRVPRRLLDRSRSVADVTLHRVPALRLDADPAAFLAQAAARAAVLTAADCLGAMERMLDLAVDYSKQRHQFGVPIGSFQAVKHAAATMLVGVEAARSAVYFAAASVDAGDPQSLLHAAAVKAQVTAEGARAADSALTLHGAIGYTWEHDLQLFFKRAKLDEQLFGPPQAWNERIADGLALV